MVRARMGCPTIGSGFSRASGMRNNAALTLLPVTLPRKPDSAAIELPAEEFVRTQKLVETSMGRRPELRFEYI